MRADGVPARAAGVLDAREVASTALDRRLQLLADRLRVASSPLLVAHVTPDGDALGSALGVALALRAVGTPARVSFGDQPLAVPRSLSFLPGQELLVEPDTVEDAPELAVTFDTASVDRLGVLGPKVAAARWSVAVDHHPSYTGYAREAVVDAAAPATAVLALAVVDRLGAALTTDIATCLYTGLATDTGSFRFAGTTPQTHLLAARLLAAGVRHDLIARRVWDDLPMGAVVLHGRALARTQLDADAAGGLGLAWTAVDTDERRRFALSLEVVEGVIDLVRKAEEAEVACVLKEDDDGTWKVSLRSKGRIDVSGVAVALGGGGHRYAAGFTSAAGPEETVRRLRARLAEAPHLAVPEL